MKSVLTFIFISLIFTPFLSAQEVLPYDIDLTLELQNNIYRMKIKER